MQNEKLQSKIQKWVAESTRNLNFELLPLSFDIV